MDFFKLFLAEGLSYFHFIFGNWGTAIIILALVVRLFLLPLQIFNSIQQRRLQRIQPQVDELSLRFKSEPLLAFQQIGALKKENGVQTWATLILSLAQIPIFLGMYQAISSSKNLLGVAFLWLPSLSNPDGFFILPLLVALATYLQFRIKPVPSMKRMGQILPIVNFVFMAAMPASLVLYYATSGVCQLASDWVLKAAAAGA